MTTGRAGNYFDQRMVNRSRLFWTVATRRQLERFREVSEPLIAAMGEALHDATKYGNARRGYAACALTDVLHAQLELALARFKAGELDYADEV